MSTNREGDVNTIIDNKWDIVFIANLLRDGGNVDELAIPVRPFHSWDGYGSPPSCPSSFRALERLSRLL